MPDVNNLARKLGTLAAVAALAALLTALLSAVGYRAGWFDVPSAFALLRWSLGLAVPAVVVALATLGIAAARRNVTGAIPAGLALLVALAAAWPPLDGVMKARSLPYIHDITTDFDNPPAFEAVLPLREGAANPPEYPGAEVADKQREAYPEVGPLYSSVATGTVFETAQAVARQRGWDIVHSDPLSGRIEAVDTTLWYGFKDDVVIRVSAADDGTRVDIRSKSRVGRSDLGQNARRIADFMARLDRALEDAD